MTWYFLEKEGTGLHPILILILLQDDSHKMQLIQGYYNTVNM